MNLAPTQPRANEPAARLLEASLVFNFVIHAVAMASMALLLLPGLPGGGIADVAERARYVAQHPLLWRAGWVPWQLTALADLLLAVALVRTAWIPRRPALVTLAVTVLAIIPDQFGQALWMTRGVAIAQDAVLRGDFGAYLSFERSTFRMVGIFGCIGYLLAAIGWTRCFATAGTWSRFLTWLSIGTWGTFGAAIVVYFLPERVSPGPSFVSFANAAGFVLLQLWFILVTERVAGRCRPAAAHGRYAAWHHPGHPLVARFVDAVARSHFARALAEWLPTPVLVSDIRDVVYVNYLVDADRLEPLVPEGLKLQRLGQQKQYALFTFLTYRHGHFGPALLGRFRRHLPSPIQSNWRIHVTDPVTRQRGVYFVSTAINSTPHALAARFLSEGVPMHVPRRADLVRDASGTVHLSLEPGRGTAPDAQATLRPSLEASLPPAWAESFDDWRGFLEYCLPQDRAMCSQPWYGRVARQEIELEIPLKRCQRLEGKVESRAAAAIVGDAVPICFYVPSVTFRFDREVYDLPSAPPLPAPDPKALPTP